MTILAPRPLAASLAMALFLTLPAAAADQPVPEEPGSKTAIDRDTGRLRATTAAIRIIATQAPREREQRRGNQHQPLVGHDHVLFLLSVFACRGDAMGKAAGLACMKQLDRTTIRAALVA